MASALFKKFQDEQAKKDAEYKAWENDQWEKNKDQWTKEGYTRNTNANSAWGSTWSYIRPENPVSPPPPADPPKDEVEQESAYAKAKREGTVSQLIGKKPVQEEIVTPVVEEEKITPFVFQGDKYYWNENTFKTAFNEQLSNYLTGIGEDLSQYKYNLKDAYGRPVATDKVDITQHPQYQQYLSEAEKLYKKQTDRLLGFMYTKYKQGGTMNKVKYFQKGGQPQTQNDVQRQVEALVEAALAGDQKATQQVNQIMQAAKQGDQQAVQLAQMIQTAAQKLQGQATMNKWGSKLQYIKSLKFAKGGKTCPACMKDGGNTVKVAKKDIDKETYQRLSSEQKTEADRHYLGTATSDNKDGSYNISHKPSAQDSTHISRKLMSKNMSKKYPIKKKCGGVAKKHQTGGEFYFNESNPMRMSNGRNVVGIVNKEIFKNPTNIGISQTVYSQEGRPVVQKDKTSNGGEREIYYNVPKSVKRKGFIGSRYEMGNDTVYVSGTPEMFQNSPNMSTAEKRNQANRFAYGM